MKQVPSIPPHFNIWEIKAKLEEQPMQQRGRV